MPVLEKNVDFTAVQCQLSKKYGTQQFSIAHTHKKIIFVKEIKLICQLLRVANLIVAVPHLGKEEDLELGKGLPSRSGRGFKNNNSQSMWSVGVGSDED